jgi:Septum formation
MTTPPSDPTSSGDAAEPSGPAPSPPGPAPAASPYGGPAYGSPAYGSPAYGAPGPVPGNPYAAGSYAAYGGTNRPPIPPPSRAMAIWALVLGWIPCAIGFVVSVVLAIIVLSRSRGGQDHGKKLAIGGLVGVVVWIVLIVLVLVADPFGAKRDSSGHVTRAGDVTIDGLRVGDCGEKALSGITRTVHVVPCSQAHVFEVLATFELSGGPFPGDDTVKRLAEGGCVKRLSRMHELQGRDDLRLTYLHPISQTWRTQKTVICMVNTSQPTTGSVRAPGA